MKKEKVIVYGLGKAFESSKYYLCDTFDILAYSDKKWDHISLGIDVIPPDKIINYPYEYVYITSQKYADEIEEELFEKYGIDKDKMLTVQDMWWFIQNENIRNKWVVQKLGEIPSGLSILDAGAGNMPYKRYCNHLQYISQDFGAYDEETCETGLQFKEWNSMKCDIKSDIIDIPLKDSSMDVVLCTEVFEHIKNPLKALQEFARILKINGMLLLTAPFCSITHMAPYYYTNGFSQYWYQENLSEMGFEILEIEPYGNWFTYLAQEIERLPYVAKRYGQELDSRIISQMMQIIRVLMKQSSVDKGSNELLCFGYMVKARKK